MEVLRPQVRVQVEDVNEAPRFPPEGYEASVVSIAPFKTPVVHVKVNITCSAFYLPFVYFILLHHLLQSFVLCLF